jgi:hypothetical protein
MNPSRLIVTLTSTLAAVLGTLPLPGCGGVTCGEGTEELDGKCIADPSTRCGAGTTWNGVGCVASGDTGDTLDAESPDSGDTARPEPPSAWTCEADRYGEGLACDCGCGALDVDCTLPGLPVAGCGPSASCSGDGLCQSALPAAWTCEPWRYGDEVLCDCGCGAPDPDCAEAGNPVLGCANNACKPDGTCAACTPDCEGRQCGGDGCGGSCGDCLTAGLPFCQSGTCVAECQPSCPDGACGQDGCGGSCGNCGAGETCALGSCQSLPENLSCVGQCGGTAAGGCSCQTDCILGTTCCPDFVSACPGGAP